MHRIRVGVVRGGPSSEHEVSLKTGEAMLKHLPEHYEPIDIVIDTSGTWRVGDRVIPLDELSHYVDVILNGLHGEYGEDGKIQRELDQFGIPYTGSGSVASATAFNKHLAKELFKKYDVRIAPHVIVTPEETTKATLAEIFRTHPAPYVVKPVRAGSSVATRVAYTLDELTEAVEDAFNKGFREIMIEQLIKGREGTCGVIENFRGEDLYALPPVEIIPPEGNAFFDFDAKYSGKTREVCPGNFTHEEKETMQDAAKTIHKALGLSHYSRSDFIVTPRGIYALEVNTLPGMTPESLMPKAVDAVGTSFSDFLDHLIKLAHRHA